MITGSLGWVKTEIWVFEKLSCSTWHTTHDTQNKKHTHVNLRPAPHSEKNCMISAPTKRQCVFTHAPALYSKCTDSVFHMHQVLIQRMNGAFFQITLYNHIKSHKFTWIKKCSNLIKQTVGYLMKKLQTFYSKPVEIYFPADWNLSWAKRPFHMIRPYLFKTVNNTDCFLLSSDNIYTYWFLKESIHFDLQIWRSDEGQSSTYYLDKDYWSLSRQDCLRPLLQPHNWVRFWMSAQFLSARSS